MLQVAINNEVYILMRSVCLPVRRSLLSVPFALLYKQTANPNGCWMHVIDMWLSALRTPTLKDPRYGRSARFALPDLPLRSPFTSSGLRCSVWLFTTFLLRDNSCCGKLNKSCQWLDLLETYPSCSSSSNPLYSNILFVDFVDDLKSKFIYL